MQDLCSQRNGSAAVGSKVWNENKGTLIKDSLINSIPEANCTGAVSAQSSIPSSVIFSSNFSGVKGASDNNASSPINAHLEDSLSSLSQTSVPAAEAASHGVGASTVCRSYEYDNSQYSNSQSAQFFPIAAGQSHFASSPTQRVDLPAIGNIACDRTQGSSVNKSLNQIPHLGAKDAHSVTCAGNSSLKKATFPDKPNNYCPDMQAHVQRKMDSNSRYNNNNDMTTSSHGTNSVNAGFMPNSRNNIVNGVHSNNNLQFGANPESNNQNSFGAQYNNAANSRAKNQSSNCESNFNSPYSGWPGLNTSTSVPSSNGWIVSNNISSPHDVALNSKDGDMTADNELSYSNIVGGTENEDQQQQSNTKENVSWGMPSRIGENSGTNGWNNQCPVTSSGSNTWNSNRQNSSAISNSSGDNSDMMDNPNGFTGLIGATGGSDYTEGKQNGGNNFKQESSRPLPPRIGLLGGGESSLNTASSGWSNNGAGGNGNSTWGGGNTRTNNGQSDMSGNNNSGMSPPKPHNSWAQAAGKGLNQAQSSGNGNHDGTPSTPDSRNESSDVTNVKAQSDTSEIKVKAAAIEGWGQTPINQDAPWDLPPSPQTTKDPVLKDPPPSTPMWRAPVNNGTEIWENNLRMNKGVPAPVTTTAPPWGHTPSTNIGGHWGDDDVSSNVWSGAPQNNPAGNSNWSDPKVPNAMWGNTNPSVAMDKHWGGNNNQGGNNDWDDGVGEIDDLPYDAQRPRTVGNWSPVSTPKKEVPPSGWELPSPPPNRRPPMTNYDDGTAAWGNPQRQGKVSHWKDMPSAKPIMNSNNNMGGNPAMMQTMGGNMQVSGPGMIRLPSGATVNNKNDMEAMWNKSGNRNARWQDMPSHDGPNIGTWGEEPMHMNNSKNMQGNNMGGNGGGWNDQQNNSAGGYWAGNNSNKSKNNNWADGQVDTSSWLGPTKQGGKPLTRDLIYASKQFRLLIEHGFKREDAENALRNNNMNFEEALAELRAQMAMDGNMMDNDVFHGRKVRPANLQEDMSMPDNMFDLNFGAVHGSGFQGGGNFQGVGNIGSFKPQVKGPNKSSTMMNSGLGPQSAAGSINNFTPVFQKLLQQQQQPQPQANLQQYALNTQQLNNQASRTGQNNFPSNAQLRHLVQQIQMAVQAGHLNSNILNQTLAPQTLQLLFQMLQQIQVLHQLQNAPKSILGGSGSLQLNVQITQTKQRIINLQNQINVQQAIFLKQQVPIQPAQMHTPQGSNDLFKPNVESIPTLHNDFRDLSIKDALLQSHQQSRLNQWKLPSFDKEENPLCLSSNEFSRAPGPLSSKTSSASSSGPNLHPLLSQGDSAWSSLSRSQGESGWPESTTSLTGIPDNSAGSSNIPVSSAVPPNLGMGNNNGGGSLDAKESSITPSSSGPSTSSASHTSYNLTDLVPEFEPGKPWKGMQMKNIEDDPHITPGSIARSPLSVTANKDNLLWNPKSSSVSTSGNDTSSSLVSNTWNFTQPNTTITNSSGLNKSGNTKLNWSTNDSNAGSDMWGPKSRGVPPIMSGTQGWEKQGNSAFLLLRNLTPQIDGSTLKTLCMQHGPLVLFHLSLNHGIALVRYSTKEEASKAQSALNNCVLGNTTILADIPNDAEVPQYLVLLSSQNTPAGGYFPWSGSQQGSSNSSTSISKSARSNNNNNATYPFSLPSGNSTSSATSLQESNSWNGNNLNMPSQLWAWGMPQPTSDHDSSTNASLNRFLPDDLLGGESM